MPQQFAVIETVNPGGGTATLTHDPMGGLPDTFQRKLRKIQLDAPPWHHTGRQPYAWDYTPAETLQGFPVLTLVLDRNVRMLWTKADWFSDNPGPQSPRLVLVRAQDSDLVPPRQSPVRAHQIVKGAFPWAAARDDTVAWWASRFALRNLRSTQAATVIPFGNGVTVRDDAGNFEFSITAPPAERAAFAYEIIFPQELGYSLRCVHTSNVEISGWITRDFDAGIPQIFLQHAVVHRIDQVPAQGAVLDRFAYEYFTGFDIRLSSSARRVVSVLEAVIGVIPILGALYDAAQLVYTVANGRTFWGETAALSDDEICMQGLCAILNIAVSAAEVTSALSRVIKARPHFAPALDKGVADSLRANLDSRFAEVFTNMSSGERKKLVAALDAYAAGQLQSRGVLSVANEGIAGKLKTLTAPQLALDKVFSENLASFRSADLAEGYKTYLAKAKWKPRAGPVEWAAKQTTGRYAELLRGELGDDFRSVLGALIDANVVKTVTPEALVLIDRYGAAVSHYRDLRSIAAGYGNFFEVDHLFEQRFWKSPRLNDVIDKADLLGMIVARDPQIAQQIPGYLGYVHSQKTGFLRELIPNGQEDLFTMQQWWDAHVYVGRQVKIPESVLRGELRDEFEFLIAHSDHPATVDFRFDQVDADFKPPKWKTR